MEITNTLKSKLVLGKDLPFGIEFIKQPTINKILDTIGEEHFMSYIQPFVLTPDLIGFPEEIKRGHGVLELLFFMDTVQKMQDDYKEENSMIQMIKSSLHFFFDTDDVILYEEHMKFLVNHSIYIDKDNFDDLSDLILLICKAKKAEKSKVDINKMNNEEKRRYEMLMRGKKKHEDRHKNDDNCSLGRIINAVANYGGVNYNVGNLTYWQLINSYQTHVNQEVYRYNMQSLFYVTSESAKDVDRQHWSEKFKI